MREKKDGFLSKEEVRERETAISEKGDDLLRMVPISKHKTDLALIVAALEERVTRLENERVAAVNNQFEIWMDNKVRGFSYGPDLKKVVMPQCVGKTAEESRKIFFVERDKLVKERYPGKPTPMWI